MWVKFLVHYSHLYKIVPRRRDHFCASVVHTLMDLLFIEDIIYVMYLKKSMYDHDRANIQASTYHQSVPWRRDLLVLLSRRL